MGSAVHMRGQVEQRRHHHVWIAIPAFHHVWVALGHHQYQHRPRVIIYNRRSLLSSCLRSLKTTMKVNSSFLLKWAHWETIGKRRMFRS